MSGRDRSKLPKWAQDEMALLESNADYWKAKVLGEAAETDTLVSHGLERQSLPTGSRVQFGIIRRDHSNGYRSERGIEVRWDEDHECLQIHSDEAIAVQPHASNCVRIVRRKP